MSAGDISRCRCGQAVGVKGYQPAAPSGVAGDHGIKLNGSSE